MNDRSQRASEVPEELRDIFERPMFPELSEDVIEAGAVRLFASVVQDSHPDYWAEGRGGQRIPPAMLSVWNRPVAWNPNRLHSPQAMRLHFLVKERLALPKAVVVDSETEIVGEMACGDHVRSTQILQAVGPIRSNRLGTGRNWTIRVEYWADQRDILLGTEVMGFYGYAPEGCN